MYVFVVTLHVILCVLLVFIILMQPGKGADVSSAFGGGASSQLFGAAGPGNFLTKGTGIFAGLFMVTSVALALYSTDSARSGGDVGGEFEDVLQEGEEGGGFGDGAAAPTKLETAPVE
ncbi:MAG: preprotein translocase subunit SecG, partial [Myxococcota bacterium]